MQRYAPYLSWIDAQRPRMARLLTDWCNLNTGSHHLPGLERFLALLKEEFAVLDAQAEEIELPPQQLIDSSGQIASSPLGKALLLTKRPAAPLRVFLGIHMDTVYRPEHPFQSATLLDANTLQGPGAADAKGGLVVLLHALWALEQSPFASNIGWQVLINPDEELGSPGSGPLLTRLAERNLLGLVFEPSLPDGTLVGQRHGSGNYVAVVRGRSAHAGRDHALGRNAIHALADLVVALRDLGERLAGITLNVGNIEGGGPVNVVPDLAIARFNVRFARPEDQSDFQAHLDPLLAEINRRDGLRVDLHGGVTAPPKPLNERTHRLLDLLAACGRELHLPIRHLPSGGVCDGNRLAAAGLPTVDTLGPRGGNIHSDREYILLDSLPERARLASLLLMKLAAGQLKF